MKKWALKTLRLQNISFSFVNWFEFYCIYKDVFLLQEYRFTSHHEAPYILDCGAHIGVSTLYFKKQYPKSRVVSFEPDARNVELLKKNIAQNNLHNVTVVPAAVLDHEGTDDFYVQKNPHGHSWGNSAVGHDLISEDYETVTVPAVRLSPYIDRQVDLLKLDIEGAELQVLHEIEKKLQFVDTIIMELHTTDKNRIEVYHEVAAVLKKYSFEHSILELGIIKGKKIRPEDMKKARSKYYLIYAKKVRLLAIPHI